MKRRKLKAELAITVDAVQPFVQATYSLKGDGPLALVAYEQVSMLQPHCNIHQALPNLNAVAREFSGSAPGRKQQLTAYAKASVKPEFTYFNEYVVKQRSQTYIHCWLLKMLDFFLHQNVRDEAISFRLGLFKQVSLSFQTCYQKSKVRIAEALGYFKRCVKSH